jgi:nucleotide-binding universal stress UspA family protein
MLRLQSILCPIDFSDESALALRWAVALAVRNQSRLTVLTAVDSLLAEAARVRLGVDLVSSDAEPALREFVRGELPQESSWTPRMAFEARIGDPPEVILEEAQRVGADLIAMGTHGSGGFQKLLLGSTAELVLRQTTRPVLAVPGVKCTSVALAADGPRFGVKQVLMATDFSKASATALQWSVDIAQHADATLVLCHVVSRSSMPTAWLSRMADVHEGRTREAQSRLEALAARVGETVKCETVVEVGRPPDAIAFIAEKRGASLIVLGLFSHSAAGSPGPGSIAYRVVSLARVPVLVVPPAET